MTEHTHGSAAGTHRRALVCVLVLTTAFLAVEVIASFATRSLILLADAGHMLTDVVGLGMTLWAIHLAGRASTARKTYGYYRVEILAALANCVLLLGTSAYILVEAWHRFRDPPAVVVVPMLLVAIGGLAVNLLAAWLLHRGARQSLNLHGAFLEVMSDLLGSAAAIVAGTIMLFTGWRLADPLFSAGIGLFILPRTYRLLRTTVDVLLEGTPDHLDMSAVQRALLGIEGVVALHDLHAWTVTSGFVAMSGHIVTRENAVGNRVLLEAHMLLRTRFGLDHVTLQVETESLSGELEQPCLPGGERCYVETEPGNGG